MRNRNIYGAKRRGAQRVQECCCHLRTSSAATSRRAFQILRANGNLPSAVITSNDIIAGGVILECLALGISVPAELSVTGFGDLDIAAQFSPSITTVRTPRSQLGSIAATYLIRKLRGEDAIDDLRLDVELIVRESTGPA
ncbi:substrate-binding domain-containing protein [Microvirga antarctica]|uniref:substrate-binding domain-containing protein n=1 Tax=Microvirga antarctica TaxID=2819233 RepID=UPI001B316CCA|nr:substrate-binding domain-containing protein [Microvirga antarctica]